VEVVGDLSPDDRPQLTRKVMTEKEPNTQEAILLATIDCINEYGIEHLTTRMIAEKANANIASINYYFRTKEQLVNQALEITIKHMLEDVLETIEDPELPFRKTLYDVFYYLIEGASSNLGISHAHLYRLVVEKDYQSISAQSFLAAFDSILDRAKGEFPEQDPTRLRWILASIFSSIMFMMLTPYFFHPSGTNQVEAVKEMDHKSIADHFTEMFYSMV
jgi:AcrR family transcriptional regulator